MTGPVTGRPAGGAERMAGPLRKLEVSPGAGPSDPARYVLRVGQRRLELNPRLGQFTRLTFSGIVRCVNCGRAGRRSHAQGYCYPCSRRLARCDLCILQPERCHYRLGTCREPQWGLAHCMRPHLVYLANASGLKVGITGGGRGTGGAEDGRGPERRWLDQGAAQALPVLATYSRWHAGLVEQALRGHVSDRTDWREMLAGEPGRLDLARERDRLLAVAAPDLERLRPELSEPELAALTAEPVRAYTYPILEYPRAVKQLDPRATPLVQGTLLGLKGQYLILDWGVLNVRRYTGYEVEVQLDP